MRKYLKPKRVITRFRSDKIEEANKYWKVAKTWKVCKRNRDYLEHWLEKCKEIATKAKK